MTTGTRVATPPTVHGTQDSETTTQTAEQECRLNGTGEDEEKEYRARIRRKAEIRK
uniref:Uncharacterized protein n=1 Tax=Hyaloperonospora arabidopsidis (strain Emoy2) TaxID=559515 RepID=M4BR99_HYAAE